MPNQLQLSHTLYSGTLWQESATNKLIVISIGPTWLHLTHKRVNSSHALWEVSSFEIVTKIFDLQIIMTKRLTLCINFIFLFLPLITLFGEKKVNIKMQALWNFIDTISNWIRVVAGGRFIFCCNSSLVKIGEVSRCVTKNIGYLH